MPSLSETGQTDFILPSPALRPYITTYYFFEIQTPDGQPIDDLLHPEWPSARYMHEGRIDASIIPEPPQYVPPASMTGPTLHACHIRCSRARVTGVGITPLGWHKLTGADAGKFADRVFDIKDAAEFRLFEDVWNGIRALGDNAQIAGEIDRILLAALQPATPRDERIEALHLALMDPDIADVTQLAGKVGMAVQSMERLSRRVFGFPPKKLLRRQRFVRTLGHRLLDPALRWNDAMDEHYHDQAHFTREFHNFMGMSPSQYLAMPRPISRAAIRARTEALGQPLQVLHRPDRES